jgi:hypothetical protein
MRVVDGSVLQLIRMWLSLILTATPLFIFAMPMSFQNSGHRTNGTPNLVEWLSFDCSLRQKMYQAMTTIRPSFGIMAFYLSPLLPWGPEFCIHAGDIHFNGIYPFIDQSSGGTIDGVIGAIDKIISIADADTKIIPGHGPPGSRKTLQDQRDLLPGIHFYDTALTASVTLSRGLTL